MHYLKIATVLFLFSRSSNGADISSQFKEMVKSHLDSKTGYELPKQKGLVESVVGEIESELLGTPSKLNENIKADLNAKGYSIEIKTFGDCAGLGASDCQAAVLGRRSLSVTNDDLRKVVDTYISDLRYPNDKTVTVHGLTIERHQWEFEDSRALKIVSESPRGPMELGHEYRIKKCRDGFMVSWKCNTISYKLFQLDKSSFLLLGRQTETTKEPLSYEVQGCTSTSGEQAEKSCKKKFLEDQRANSSAGILSMALFKTSDAPALKDIVKITEINAAGVGNASEVKRLQAVQDNIEDGLASEYKILSGKLLGKRLPASVCTSSSHDSDIESGSQSGRLFGFLIGCLVAFFAMYFSTYCSSNLNRVEITTHGHKVETAPTQEKSMLEANAELNTLMSRLRQENATLKESLAMKSSETRNIDSMSIVLQQRAFIHDISSPLAVSQGMLDIVLINIEKQSSLTPVDIEKLKKAVNALERLIAMVNENRKSLHLES